MKPVEYVPKLSILLEKEKRLKILVGGRGSTKSTFVADYVLACLELGQLWCCAREYQNTIEESVHRLLTDEVERLELAGFDSDKMHIYHASGGRNFYRGLARNPSGMKSSLTGVHGLWIEEGENLSEDSITKLSASLRPSAKDVQRRIAGEDILMPEIWITMNRGSSKDPISKHWLKRAEKELSRTGIYEDEYMIVVQINCDEVPKRWFVASGLEAERADDEKRLSKAAYDHKWNGAYSDTVEDAIIEPEWFDACIDAHKKLGFDPQGVEVVTHDPSDLGSDSKGLSYRHGVVFLDVRDRGTGDVNEGGDWAAEYALDKKPDWFIWDGDGMGVALRRQFDESFKGKRINLEMFRGSMAVDMPEALFQPSENAKAKTNRQTFKNKRAQYYWLLRERVRLTYEAIQTGKYIDPDELISFSSDIKDIGVLRSELCRIPKKPNGAGLIQIRSKEEMRKLGIESPNMADSVMMSFAIPHAKPKHKNTSPMPSANRW